MGITNLWPFKQDSHSQFESLIRPHLKQLYNLAFRYTGKRDDAEDLVQDLLLKLFPRLDEMKAIEKLSPWLRRILYRQFIDQLRRQQRSPIDFMDEDNSEFEIHASHTVEPSEVANTELTRELINMALNKLQENRRRLVLLHDVEGYSLQEISEMIDIPVGTIKSRLSRARSNLREIINKMEPDSVASV
ncbi:MAG: RNA polymerase sigma factor [Gammaproteobacteria bacterium]|nr:RNA polymerase sigma factor [Gammaproteobacteria bacterium]